MLNNANMADGLSICDLNFKQAKSKQRKQKAPMFPCNHADGVTGIGSGAQNGSKN